MASSRIGKLKLNKLEKYYTINDVLNALNISRRTFQRLRNKNLFPPPDLNIGLTGGRPSLRWAESTILKYLEERL